MGTTAAALLWDAERAGVPLDALRASPVELERCDSTIHRPGGCHRNRSRRTTAITRVERALGWRWCEFCTYEFLLDGGPLDEHLRRAARLGALLEQAHLTTGLLAAVQSWAVAADADGIATHLEQLAAQAVLPGGAEQLTGERAQHATLAADAAARLRRARDEITAGWDPDGTRWLLAPCSTRARQDHWAHPPASGCCGGFDHHRLIAAHISWTVELACRGRGGAPDAARRTYGDAPGADLLDAELDVWQAELDVELSRQLQRPHVVLARLQEGPREEARNRDKVAQWGIGAEPVGDGDLGVAELLCCPAVIAEGLESDGWVCFGDEGCDAERVLGLSAALWCDGIEQGDHPQATSAELFARHAMAAAAVLASPGGGLDR